MVPAYFSQLRRVSIVRVYILNSEQTLLRNTSTRRRLSQQALENAVYDHQPRLVNQRL